MLNFNKICWSGSKYATRHPTKNSGHSYVEIRLKKLRNGIKFGHKTNETDDEENYYSTIQNHSYKKCIVIIIVGVIFAVLVVLLVLAVLNKDIIYGKLFPNSDSENAELRAGRWSWTFKASEIFNAKLGDHIMGKEGSEYLGAGRACGNIKWQPCFVVVSNNSSKIPFLLKYTDGPPNLHATRSMLLIADDGRELMTGNDFNRNPDGYTYNIGQYDEKTFALDRKFLENMSDDKLLTLKIEVFVDPATTKCDYKREKPKKPINYEEECKRLATNAKLFMNGSCYVGSNTATHFAFAIQRCNHIPSAVISRLAWIESNVLLNRLRYVMKTHLRTGEQTNHPYYIGARSLPNKGWQWINSELMPKKSFPANFEILNDGNSMEQYKVDHDYAVIFKDQESKISAVSASAAYHYLCEYRDQE